MQTLTSWWLYSKRQGITSNHGARPIVVETRHQHTKTSRWQKSQMITEDQGWSSGDKQCKCSHGCKDWINNRESLESLRIVGNKCYFFTIFCFFFLIKISEIRILWLCDCDLKVIHEHQKLEMSRRVRPLLLQDVSFRAQTHLSQQSEVAKQSSEVLNRRRMTSQPRVINTNNPLFLLSFERF